MKLFPKNAKFCPGCPKKDLKLNSAPELVIKLEKHQDNKIYTLKEKLKSGSSKIGGLF